MSTLFESARTHFTKSVIESLFHSNGAHWSGDEFLTINPIDGGNGKIKSFSINSKGLYNDFSTDDKGDLIDLVSKSMNMDNVEAAKHIIKTGGGVIPEDDFKKDSKTESKKQKKNDNSAKYPIPDTEEIKTSLAGNVKSAFYQNYYGIAKNAYAYRDYKGKIVFYTIRFEKDGKKQVIPFYYTNDGNWINKRPDLRKFPVYGCEKLKGNELPVIIVEGEKCGDCEVPGYVIISFIGGAKGTDKTDWKVLENREVIIFPDVDMKRDNSGHMKRSEDQPGMSGALKIKANIPQAKIVNIGKIDKSIITKDGWDIADAIKQKIDIPDMIEKAGFCYDIDVKLDPYDLHKVFINERYGYGNLDQIDGLFFRYNEKKHYWSKLSEDNIKPDVKTWLEKTGLIDLIRAAGKNLKTMINDINTFVQSHAVDYIDENPFKESGLSPWIHHKDGAIKVSHDGFEFFDREHNDEYFFKNMYPLVCLDYGISENVYTDLDIERDCPGFYYYVSNLIPDKIKETDIAPVEIKKTVELFSQILAYSFSPVKKDQFFFGLIGTEGTGKSFFVDLIKKLIGEDFVVERPIKDTENRFAASDFLNSKVFIEPDMAAGKMLPDDFIKAYAGEQSITIENKFENAIKGVKISISMFIVSNNEIKVSNKQGINRRLILVKFNNPLKYRDKLLKDKICGKHPHGKESGSRAGETFDERPAILALALKGWLSFTKNNHSFTIPKWIKEGKEKWNKESDTASMFLEDDFYQLMTDPFEHISGKELFVKYTEWCKDEKITHAYGRKRFYEEIRTHQNIIENNNGGKVNFKIENPKVLEEKEYTDKIPF